MGMQPEDFTPIETEDKALSVLKEFYKKKGVEIRTKLTNMQMIGIIQAEAANNYWSLKYGVQLNRKQFTQNFKVHALSVGGYSFEHAMDVLEAREIHQLEKEEGTKSLIGQLIGKK